MKRFTTIVETRYPEALKRPLTILSVPFVFTVLFIASTAWFIDYPDPYKYGSIALTFGFLFGWLVRVDQKASGVRTEREVSR